MHDSHRDSFGKFATMLVAKDYNCRLLSSFGFNEKYYILIY